MHGFTTVPSPRQHQHQQLGHSLDSPLGLAEITSTAQHALSNSPSNADYYINTAQAASALAPPTPEVAFELPLAQDENISPSGTKTKTQSHSQPRTSTQSPTCSPFSGDKAGQAEQKCSSGRSTPLRRRFLREVTPSPDASPQSARQSNKGRSGSGKKTRGKLEVGLDGFYFSVEIPEWKIVKKGEKMSTPKSTPRKSGPSRMSRPTTPANRTPSKVPATSPLRKVVTPAQGSPKRAGAAAKVLFETPSKQVATPDPMKRMGGTAPAWKLDDREAEVKAVLGSDTPVLAVPPKCSKDVNKYIITRAQSFTPPGPVPASAVELVGTPSAIDESIRKPSYDMGDLMAGLKDHTMEARTPSGTKIDEQERRSPTPTPLRKAAEKLGFTLDIKSKAILTELIEELVEQQSPLRPETRTLFPADSTALHEPLCSPVLFPSPICFGCASGPIKPVESLHVEEHIELQDGSPSKPRRTLKRTGTDPLTLFTMRKEMDQIKKSMRKTIGPDYACGGEMNAFTLPELQNVSPEKEDVSIQAELELTIAGPEAVVDLKEPLIDVTQEHTETKQEQLDKTLGATVAEKRLGLEKRQFRIGPHPRHKLLSRPVKRFPASPASKVANATPLLQASPATKTSAPSKPINANKTIPKGPGKSTPSVPAYARPTLTSSQKPQTPTKRKPPTTRKSILPRATKSPAKAKAIQVDTIQVPSQPVQTNPQPTQPPPQQDTFASALDIAQQISKWNNEDKATAMPPPPKSPIRPVTPAKPANPMRRPLATPAKLPPTSRIATLDHNAFRTPSKGIQSSLDRAIDAKIEEDARSGKEFTPSGNRIRDLLEARMRV